MLAGPGFTWLAIFFLVLAWSGWQPHDYPTWWLEVAPALIVLLVLAFTRKRFTLTPLAYWLILAHALVLMVGGHYTYAEVPLGDWVSNWMGGGAQQLRQVGALCAGIRTGGGHS